LILVGLAPAVWIIARIAGGRPRYLLSYACAGVVALAFALTNRPMDLEGTRQTVRSRVVAGQTIEVEISLTGRKRFSTFVLEEEIPTSLGEDPRVSVAAFEPGDEVSHTYPLTLWRRGAYVLGPLTVRWGDPFGLTQRRKVLAEPFEVLVHPNVETVQDRPLTRLWEDPPIRPPISKPWPTGMEFYGMREYARGDDIRRIVWRAYARTGKILIRESEQGITDKLTILLDNDRRTHSRGHVSDSFEAAVKVASSLAVRHLNEGYSVTLETNDKRLAGPLRGPKAQLAMLDQLARVERVRSPITDAVIRLVYNSQRDAHIVMVTPLLDMEAAARVRLLVERGSSVLIAALMWNEDAVDTLSSAAALGAQVVEVRPNTPLSVAFRHEVSGFTG
jgi:uncharacterized protein (DUF58 family)